MVMSIMFMNIAATNTTLTLTLGLMCMRGNVRSWTMVAARSGRAPDPNLVNTR